jgi:methionyl-tRNA formyltransferase
LGGGLLIESLDALAAGTAVERPQAEAGATYADKIQKSEALIDWCEPADAIARRVRAFNPWPIVETRLNGAQLRIFEAEPVADGGPDGVPAAPGHVLAAGDAGIDVACGAGTLRISILQLAGRKPLPAAEFIKGQRLVGASFAST